MAKRKKRRIKLSALFTVLLAVCALIAGCYLFEPAKPPPAPPAPTDYRQAAGEIQALVDDLLKANNISVQKTIRTEKKYDHKAGTVLWTERSQLLTADNRAIRLEELSEQINKRLKEQKIKVTPIEQDSWDGQPAERLDIVLHESLAGEPLKLTVDRLYFTIAKAAPPIPPPPSVKGKLAIVIDDCGYDMDAVNKMSALRQKLSFAVIPYREFSKEALKRINDTGKQALLHLPMEPLDSSQQSEKTTVSVNMSEEQIQKITKDALAQLPDVAGVNNHQGSRATADEKVMRAVLSVIKSRQLFF